MRNHPVILLFCGAPAIVIGLLGHVLFGVVEGLLGAAIAFGFLMHLLWTPKGKDKYEYPCK